MAYSHDDITDLVRTGRPAVPQLYAYTTPGVTYHDGWTKIGYTERNVVDRIREQTRTAHIKWALEWHGNATFERDGKPFKDTEFHGYLERQQVPRERDEESGKKTEWFEISGDDSHHRFYDFRESHGIIDTPEPTPYELRDEQERAVEETALYADGHPAQDGRGGGEFLWNAKPRFGKTLTAYDLCLRLDAKRVLIVTNRPAIANSWYDDYVRFLGLQSGLCFISTVQALSGRPHVMTRDDYRSYLMGHHDERPGFIEFVSLQDLKGAISFGGSHDKLEHVADITWDVLVIDEAHEGVDTLKTDVAFDHIRRRFTLHLSGTPFKAIADEKFPDDAIYNWTYADEQQAKRDWADPQTRNPYEDMPQLNLFTYQMSEVALSEAERGIQIDGKDTEYAFDLNEFFSTKNGQFEHGEAVDRFLDALVTQRKFPFSTPNLRDQLRHTFWLLNRVDSARALAKRLRKHLVFKEYEVVLAAGDGKLDDDDANADSYKKVMEAIRTHERTITLSVGQLTTGVTVPEWTAVLMLSNMRSPALYMQAAFRCQNPCLFDMGDGSFVRKENAYVFDFDPARTLEIFERFADDLYTDTAAGAGDSDKRKQRVRRLLNFFPVYGEDDDGEMVELDAERVLSIPRRIHSREVVRHGFMCNYLFQNVSGVFRAPKEVVDVIQRLPACKEGKLRSGDDVPVGVDGDTADALDIDGNGDVDIPVEKVIGTAQGIFGPKVYEDVDDELERVVDAMGDADGGSSAEDRELDRLQEHWGDAIADPLVGAAESHYGDEMRAAQRDRLRKRIKRDVQVRVNRHVQDYKIDRNKIENERRRDLDAATTEEERAEANARADKAIRSRRDGLRESLMDIRTETIERAGETITREVETARREAKKSDIEDAIRDHLRGFSRTIPSFLMAYGDDETTLETFDRIVPEDVFLEVTGITVDQFRFLRDGGDFVDGETGETAHFPGHLFDPVVFDDSVREFNALRTKLANYFDEDQTEDIFDYIPPQRTNQIFTPRRVVVDMVDMFERENPGCFDDPTHTFADLYMKSGLYITEIVKRLFRSGRMRELYPDDQARLRHIFERQVFGVAPTRIIYEIATHYILGPRGEVCPGVKGNFECEDTAELAKDDKLDEYVERVFGERLS